MYTHYTTTKNKQQFNSIWLNLQHTHIAFIVKVHELPLCCKGTWVTYMKKEVLLVKKKNTTAWSPLITYTVHLSVRLRVNRGRKIKPELTFYVQTATRFHGAWLTMCLALNWALLRLHKKNNLWSLQGYNHIIHKSLFVTKGLLLPVIPHS